MFLRFGTLEQQEKPHQRRVARLEKPSLLLQGGGPHLLLLAIGLALLAPPLLPLLLCQLGSLLGGWPVIRAVSLLSGLRGNVQETIDFPTKYGAFL